VLVCPGAHVLRITRSPRPFDRPILLQAVGAEVCEITSTPRQLAFRVRERTHTVLKIYTPSAPRLTIAGKETAVEWDEQTHILWHNAVLSPEERVIVEIV